MKKDGLSAEGAAHQEIKCTEKLHGLVPYPSSTVFQCYCVQTKLC